MWGVLIFSDLRISDFREIKEIKEFKDKVISKFPKNETTNTKKHKIMKRLFLLLALCGMVAVGCTEGGVDDNINNGGNNTEQPGGDTDDEAIEIPSNEIWYTTTDDKRIILPSTEPTVFGAYFISNTYSDGKGVLTFDGEITKIGNDAFKDIGNLASITIPDSVTSIGGEAFRGCTSLTSITIPNSVTSIGDYAFSGCDSLTSVTIPDSVTEIGDDAFSRCISLTSVTIGNGVTSIGYNAFSYCNSLTSVTIGNSVTSIGEYAFSGCGSLEEVYCKPTTPPTGGNEMFSINASGRKIYVPTKSVDAYKSAEYWSNYADYIEGYDF